VKSTGLAIFPSTYWQIENSYLKGESDSSMRILPMQRNYARIVTLKSFDCYRTFCKEFERTV